jgi:CMP-N,N'-diacetyllegionaminic acid synthase
MNEETQSKILAIIPARGGSKGIPRKNIKELTGKPLIVYSIEAALKSKYINKIVVSTEDEEIAEISKKYGAEVIKRPRELAKDSSSIIDVLKHVLEKLREKENYNPDIIVLLQPTSPLRTVKTIDSAILIFRDKFEYYDSLIPLYLIEGKIGIIMRERYIPNYILGSRRQDIEPIYRECGTIFIFKPDLIKNGEMFGEKTLPFVIKKYKESIDIDTTDDLKIAEFFMGLKNDK